MTRNALGEKLNAALIEFTVAMIHTHNAEQASKEHGESTSVAGDTGDGRDARKRRKRKR
jgi:hypothetical protein